MNHSKYNPKYDPKHAANQPATTAAVVDTEVAQTNMSPKVAPNSDAQVDTNPNRVDLKTDPQDIPVAIKADAAISDNDTDAVIGISHSPSPGSSVHAVREPSALTGGLPELPVANMQHESDDNSPGLSAKMLS